MTKPSELREVITEIHTALVVSVHGAMSDGDGDVEARDKAYYVAADAILDAIIASLPETIGDDGIEHYDNGFNWAIGQVRSILLSAKSKGGEL